MRNLATALALVVTACAAPNEPAVDGGAGGGDGGDAGQGGGQGGGSDGCGGPFPTMACATSSSNCGAAGDWYLTYADTHTCDGSGQTIHITMSNDMLCATYGPFSPRVVVIDGCSVTMVSDANACDEISGSEGVTLSFDGGAIISGAESGTTSELEYCHDSNVPVAAYRMGQLDAGEACVVSQQCYSRLSCVNGLCG